MYCKCLETVKRKPYCCLWWNSKPWRCWHSGWCYLFTFRASQPPTQQSLSTALCCFWKKTLMSNLEKAGPGCPGAWIKEAHWCCAKGLCCENIVKNFLSCLYSWDKLTVKERNEDTEERCMPCEPVFLQSLAFIHPLAMSSTDVCCIASSLFTCKIVGKSSRSPSSPFVYLFFLFGHFCHLKAVKYRVNNSLELILVVWREGPEQLLHFWKPPTKDEGRKHWWWNPC